MHTKYKLIFINEYFFQINLLLSIKNKNMLIFELYLNSPKKEMFNKKEKTLNKPQISSSSSSKWNEG